MKSGIYKIKNPKGRVYIGQSIDVNKRISSYKNINISKRQTRLHRSLKKYGYKNHKSEILELCEIKKLNNRERFYQDYYDVLSKKGLNCTLTNTSDKSGKISKETLVKLSKIRKGIPFSLGRKHTDKTKKILSDKAKLRGLHPSFMNASKKANTGRVHSEENILKRTIKQCKITPKQAVIIKKETDKGVFQKELAIDSM